MSSAMACNIGIEAVPVITGTFLSGAMMSLFLLTIPVITTTTTSTSQLLRQWHQIWDRGHRQGPAISCATGLLYAYAAWAKASNGEAWRIFAVAGAQTVIMIPFTWIFMARVNNRLFAMLEASERKEDAEWSETEKYVQQWGRWNAVRALFPLSGAVLGNAWTYQVALILISTTPLLMI